jgi:hypothetical protein
MRMELEIPWMVWGHSYRQPAVNSTTDEPITVGAFTEGAQPLGYRYGRTSLRPDKNKHSNQVGRFCSLKAALLQHIGPQRLNPSPEPLQFLDLHTKT